MIKSKALLSVSFLTIVFCFLQTAKADALGPRLDMSSYTENAIVADINAYRAQHHLKALKISQAITKAATMHSREMADHVVPFGHDRFRERIEQLFQVYPDAHGAAENVAYAFSNSEKVVQQWLESPGHRRNIEGNYNLTGIGIAVSEDHKVYVTQIFLRSDEG